MIGVHSLRAAYLCQRQCDEQHEETAYLLPSVSQTTVFQNETNTHVPTPEQPQRSSREQTRLKRAAHPRQDPDSAERDSEHAKEGNVAFELARIPEFVQTSVGIDGGGRVRGFDGVLETGHSGRDGRSRRAR